MNHHDIRLIEIGQKEGYAKAVREIVAMLHEDHGDWSRASRKFADEIEAQFGGSDAGRSA